MKLRRGAQGRDRVSSRCATLEEVHRPPHVDGRSRPRKPRMGLSDATAGVTVRHAGGRGAGHRHTRTTDPGPGRWVAMHHVGGRAATSRRHTGILLREMIAKKKKISQENKLRGECCN